LFVDASEHYEKVKTQNVLRKEDINKIISTYAERNIEDKYSYVAQLTEIEENDYNLNIPRYVDTFEEEDPVDINAVMTEIKSLEAKRAELDRESAGYVQELGVSF